MKENLDILLNAIGTFPKNRRIILGIDGLSRSGKTTLVEGLCQALKQHEFSYCLFHIDDHIVKRAKRYHTGHEDWYEYYQLQWDTHWLRQNFFGKLKTESLLRLPFYDHQKDQQVNREIVLPINGLMIIEGVFLQRHEWKNYYDYLVYLDCPREERFVRESKIIQADLQKFQKRYWKAEDYYEKEVVPKAAAHLVLRG